MLCKKSIKNFAIFTENTTVLESLLKVQALDLTVTLSGGKSNDNKTLKMNINAILH